MSILDRFNDIIKSNINVVLDKLEDPSKMIDQYLVEMRENLAEVKKETAAVMAEETRTKRMADENQTEVKRYADLAEKALLGGNEGDARVFLSKKQELETEGSGMLQAYAAAKENAEKMRQLHDKLVTDIENLDARRAVIKSKVAIAKTQEKVNAFATAAEKTQDMTSAFGRMEEKANRMLDEATAMSTLNQAPVDEAKALEEKYTTKASVEDELTQMKNKLGL